MTFPATSLVQVFFTGKNTKQLMGRLLLQNRKIFFEYDIHFLETGLELSPFKLPLKTGVITSNDPTFDGLFGVFNDSLPDGWGRLLLDRRLMKIGLLPQTLSPLDRLCFVGSHGMGALTYEPEHQNGLRSLLEDLEEIEKEINRFQENDDDAFVDNLLTLSGSSAGVRPKILVQLKNEDWMIKFRSPTDPKDIANIEYAYYLMAKEAGLEVPVAKFFPSRKKYGYFGVKRFDRLNGQRIHMHSLSGLLHADHREANLDYESIMKATLWLTRNQQASEIQFRNAVFNVLSHNRDDHAKNFSFLMNEDGAWSVSPAYDLTFSSGPNGEHSTTLMNEGKNPRLSHMLQLAGIGDMKEFRALEIIEEVASAISKWKQFSEMAEVSKTSQKMIQMALEKVYAGF